MRSNVCVSVRREGGKKYMKLTSDSIEKQKRFKQTKL